MDRHLGMPIYTGNDLQCSRHFEIENGSNLNEIEMLLIIERAFSPCVFSPFSHLETISTSLWASLHHRFPILSVFSYVCCQFVFFHILPGVVNPSQSRPPLPLFPGTTMSIICLERLSYSLILGCPYHFSLFCLRNGWYLACFDILV